MTAQTNKFKLQFQLNIILSIIYYLICNIYIINLCINLFNIVVTCNLDNSMI